MWHDVYFQFLFYAFFLSKPPVAELTLSRVCQGEAYIQIIPYSTLTLTRSAFSSFLVVFGILFFRNSYRWKTRGRGPGYGVRGPGVRSPGVWKTRGLVENARSGGKRGVWWKTRGLSGKHGGNRIFLTKMRSLNFVISNCNEN